MTEQPPEKPEQPTPPEQSPAESQPPQGAPPPPPPGHQPPPQFVPPGGHQPPPHYGGPSPYGYYPYYQPPPKPPTNGYAVASLIVSGSALALMLFTAGILAPVTMIASIVGTVIGHKGKTDVDQGKAHGQRDEAVAGFWMGIAGIILAVIAIAAWVLLIVFVFTVDDSNNSDEIMRQFHDWNTSP